MARIRLERVGKKFGVVDAVKGLDIEVRDKEFMTLVGPSGCGKSTTLNLIAGLEELTAGRIYFDEVMVNDLSPRERNVAFVFQSYALYPHKTAYENMAFPLRMARLDKAEMRKSVERAASLLNIGHLLGRKPAELSGGERQRVALGRAIVREPKVFLFDEPLSNLDANLRRNMRTELRKLHFDLNATFIYVTHDQEEAMSLSDRLSVMRDGELVQCDEPGAVYADPVDTFVASFFGSPAINFMEARLSDEGGRLGLEIEGARFELPDKLAQRLKEKAKGAEMKLGVRPEHLRLGSGEGPSALAAEVEMVETLGSESHVFMKRGEKRIVARAGADSRAEPGQRIDVDLAVEKAIFFDPATGRNLLR